ncbi:hypothetical protein ACGFX7_26940 [Streptomyces harbinensis]|uniref:hypothetical protein n=1 Tax=Streptomyces harbinensis TaxID=1176198 RepID=UPI003710CA24
MTPERIDAPIVCADLWLAVAEAAEGRCQCTTACGSHKPERCTTEFHYQHHRKTRLLVAPADLGLSLMDAVRVPAADLRAWCVPCYKKAAGRHRADRRNRARIEAPAPDTLFDI